MFYVFFCFFDLVLMRLVIAAAVAIAVFCAEFALSETLAVHFEAFGFFAGAAVFLFLGNGGRGCHLVVF